MQGGRLARWLDKTFSFYPAFDDNRDDTFFRTHVLQVPRQDHNSLEIEAGAGFVTQTDFKVHARKVFGLEIRSFEVVESRPEYLYISPLTYVFRIAYERVVNALSGLSRCLSILITMSARLPDHGQS